MANPDHLKIFTQGTTKWNEWRKAHPGLKADLVDINILGMLIPGVDLSGADLSGACLSGARLHSAHLSGARLHSANLSGADLTGADLSGATLCGANLSYANLSRVTLVEANLSGANLFKANLSGADISNARLKNAKLEEASFNKTIFTSRAVLNRIFGELTAEQLAGCIFRNEGFTRNRKEKILFEGLPCLRLHFGAPVWTPVDASSALITAQLAINRVQYLLTTADISPEILEQRLKSPCFPEDFSQAIRLAGINVGSLEIDLCHIKEAVGPKTFTALLVFGILTVGFSSGATVYCKVQEGRRHEAEAFKINTETEKLRVEIDNFRAKDRPETRLALPSGTGSCHLPSHIALQDNLLYSNATTKYIEPKSFSEPLMEMHVKVPLGFTPESETVIKCQERYLFLAAQPMYSYISTIKDQGHEIRCRIYNAEEWAEKFGVDLTEARAAGIVSEGPYQSPRGKKK